MTPFVSTLMVLFGVLVGFAGMTCSRTQNRSRFWMVFGLLVAGVGVVWGAVYDSEQNQETRQADIAARTVIVRGTVFSSAPKNGSRYCRVVLEEMRMNTFVFAERNSMGQNCAKIKRGDVVKVKFVKPSGNYVEEIEALDFIDFADVDPPYSPKTPTRE